MAQLLELIDKIDLDRSGLRKKLEIERHKKFHSSIMGKKEKVQVMDIDVRNYAKYLLKEGSNTERRELLGCLKSSIILKDHKINLERP